MSGLSRSKGEGRPQTSLSRWLGLGLLLLVAGCANVDAPSWEQMSTGERSAYCTQLSAKYEAMVVRERNTPMGRIMASSLSVCRTGGYL